MQNSCKEDKFAISYKYIILVVNKLYLKAYRLKLFIYS